MTEPSEVLRLVQVVKTYTQGAALVRALAGVTLAVTRGEFVAVTGPSGSGKSTLLHLMGGLDRPDGGEVWIDGRRLGDLDDDAVTLLRRRRIGFVFQFFNLLPTLTAEENVALPLLLDGVPRRDVAARAERLLARVGLLARRRHRPHELSGGEMQRVAIARALVAAWCSTTCSTCCARRGGRRRLRVRCPATRACACRARCAGSTAS